MGVPFFYVQYFLSVHGKLAKDHLMKERILFTSLPNLQEVLVNALHSHVTIV